MQVICAGPCGTDWHRLDGTDTKERPGYDLQPLGHEFGGRVAAVGPGGDPSLIGRDFAVAPLVPCHVCEPCRDGSFAQCRRYQFIGSSLPGAFAEYVLVPERNLVPLPQGFDMRRAALVEPLAVALHPFFARGFIDDHGRPLRKISTAVVTGLGPIGLLAVVLLKHLGAGKIVASDVQPFRLEIGRVVGATHTVNVGDLPKGCPDDPAAVEAESLALAVGKEGADLIFEASGAAGARYRVPFIAAENAEVFWVGKPCGTESVTAKAGELYCRKQILTYGSWMSHSSPWPGKEWPVGVELLAAAAVDPLISHEVDLDGAVILFQAVLNKQPLDFAKIIVWPCGRGE